MTARSIMKGTFRLSIVAAVLAAGYGFYERGYWTERCSNTYKSVRR